MPRTKPIGISARAFGAGGFSRHGAHCGCAYCAPPVVAAGVLQPPVPINVPINPPPVRNQIDELFAATNQTIDELVAARDRREASRRAVLPVEPEHGWSPYAGVAS